MTACSTLGSHEVGSGGISKQVICSIDNQNEMILLESILYCSESERTNENRGTNFLGWVTCNPSQPKISAHECQNVSQIQRQREGISTS